MFKSFRYFSWIFSIALHLLIFLGGVYLSTGNQLKIDLNKQIYEVNLVGAPHKGKAGARSAAKASSEAQGQQKKAPLKEALEKPATEPKKPAKKEPPVKDAKEIALDTTNATKVAKEEPKKEEPKKEEPKKEEPKKEEPKKEEPKKEEPKKEEPKKEPAKTATNATKADAKNATKTDAKNAAKEEPKLSKEEILKQALGSAKAQAGTVDSDNKGKGAGVAKGGDAKGSAHNAVADALAAAGKEISGRGSRGEGTSGDGDGEGESSGTLEDWYKTKVSDAIRANWRFQRLNEVYVAKVEIKVTPAGEIISARLVHGSGRGDFDASVLQAVHVTKKLPELPQGLEPTFILSFYSKDSQ